MERHEQIGAIAAKFLNESRDVNPYATADTMRALDHVIRNGLGDGLGRAAAAWRAVYQQQSHRVGVPSRDHPFPDADQMALMRECKRISDALSDWVSRVHALPAPASDRVYHRIRDNDQLLELLIAADYHLAAVAEAIERLSSTVTVDKAKDLTAEFDEKLAELESAVADRSRMLSSVP